MSKCNCNHSGNQVKWSGDTGPSRQSRARRKSEESNCDCRGNFNGIARVYIIHERTSPRKEVENEPQ
jgi:hypothetical protein